MTRALYDYVARAPDELSFKRKQFIKVVSKDDEDDGWCAARTRVGVGRGWRETGAGACPIGCARVIFTARRAVRYRGELDGKIGLFPGNYVQPVAGPVGSSVPPRGTSAASKPAEAKNDHGTERQRLGVRTKDFLQLYTLDDSLGRGRFSVVRRCKKPGAANTCAVKILDLSDSELGASAHEAEREVLAEVAMTQLAVHRHVVKLHEAVVWDGKYYLVMEVRARAPVTGRFARASLRKRRSRWARAFARARAAARRATAPRRTCAAVIFSTGSSATVHCRRRTPQRFCRRSPLAAPSAGVCRPGVVSSAGAAAGRVPDAQPPPAGGLGGRAPARAEHRPPRHQAGQPRVRLAWRGRVGAPHRLWLRGDVRARQAA